MTRSDKRPLRIRPLAERKNLVRKEEFARVLPPVDGFLGWFRALPDIYGSKALKKVVDAIVTARQHGREVGVSLGAHVLKVGLSPLLIDLMRRGFVTHVATNGASAIHDSWHAKQRLTRPSADTFADGLATRSTYDMTWDALREGLASLDESQPD